MNSATWVLTVALVTLGTGCVLPRTGGRLAAGNQPPERTAILPVRIADTHVESGPTNGLARVGNAVLTTLASGGKSKLIPPAQTEELLQANGIAAHLFNGIPSDGSSWYYTGLAATNDAPSMERLAGFAAQTGIQRVVRTQILYLGRKPVFHADSGGFVFEWGGYVAVRMELVNLSPTKVLAESLASGVFDQSSGAFMLMIPVYIGTTYGRAMDKAAREAMESLFNQGKDAHTERE